MSDDIQPQHLKLVKPPNGPSDVLFMERRCSDRAPMIGQATAIISDSQDKDHPSKKICTIELANISDTGLGVIAKEPVEIGEHMHMTVYIQPHGPEGGYELSGTVTRCNKTEVGFDIGVSVPTRSRAAG